MHRARLSFKGAQQLQPALPGHHLQCVSNGALLTELLCEICFKGLQSRGKILTGEPLWKVQLCAAVDIFQVQVSLGPFEADCPLKIWLT